MTLMTRLLKLDPKNLNHKQRMIYESITSGKRASGKQHFELVDKLGRLNGPFNAFMLSPELGFSLASIGESIRYKTQLSDRIREIAILLVAKEFECEFEWYAHAPIAVSLSIDKKILEDILSSKTPIYQKEDEQLIHSFCLNIIRRDNINEQMYEQVVHIIGENGIFELVSLIGYYSTLAMVMDIFKIDAPEYHRPVFSG